MSDDCTLMTFGKYARQPIGSVPDSYLEWCAKNMPRIPCYVILEMNRRNIEIDLSWVSDIQMMGSPPMAYYKPSDCHDREQRSKAQKRGMKWKAATPEQRDRMVASRQAQPLWKKSQEDQQVDRLQQGKSIVGAGFDLLRRAMVLSGQDLSACPF